ncbi:MAG: WD40 repeat domain-containing protein [Pirellulaceae bacterium]
MWFFDIQFSICHRLAASPQWLIPPEALAQPAPEPVLRIDTGGHSSYVTSLVWNRDGDELLSAGWDKLVRVWRASDAGSFVNLPQRSLRLPIGPGPSGKFDGIALSDSGRWLAIGGYASLAARAASFRDNGIELPLSDVELLEQGVIYVLDREQKRLQRLEDIADRFANLLFATSRDGMEQLLSAGFDRSADQKPVGSLRTWDVVQGRQLAGCCCLSCPRIDRPWQPSQYIDSGWLGHVLAAMGSGKMYQWETSQPPNYAPIAMESSTVF